ncbi:MAG: hypothetical protein KME67_05105 [Candidatus Thiodiazotropha sp. (ex Codakia orbicularis)]|nr:hypothetical protein [Candidatus Thiodiazotropha sp. (ex Codakia orbicularis)]
MEQLELIHEDIYEALRTCIGALGGPKKVGVVLKPEMSVDKARNWLNDCLNPSKRDKLDIEQVLWILRESRKIGCHAAMYFIANHCNYRQPEPIEPLDEMAELQKAFIQSVAENRRLLERMERMQTLQSMDSNMKVPGGLL